MEILSVPLQDPSFICLLRAYRLMLKSSVGPDGNFKIFVSGGGYVQLFASSSQLMHHYDQFGSPVIRFIAQVMKSQCDFGLYSGLIMTSSLENLLTLQNTGKMTPKCSVAFLNSLIEDCNELLSSDKLKIKITFDSVSNFVPLVLSVLKSKSKTIFMDKCLVMDLCIEIIKAFLFTLDVEKMLLGKVIIENCEGHDEYKFFPGILYRLTDDDKWISKNVKENKTCRCLYKTLLITMALDNDINNVDETEGNFKILWLLEKALKLGVNVIGCQKVVHSNITLFLRRKSVLILERMGSNLATYFEQVTGSFPISNLNTIHENDLPLMTGTLSCISVLELSEKSYLLMERTSSNIATLLVKTCALAAAEQIKVLVEQALNVIGGLMKSPYVTPGGGCFELSLFLHITSQALRKERNLGSNILWLLKTLLEASGHKLPIWVDTVFNHAWTAECQVKCNCRLISKNMVNESRGTLELVSFDNESVINIGRKNCHKVINLTPDAVVDSFLFKYNSLVASFESCMHLLNIGTIVY